MITDFGVGRVVWSIRHGSDYTGTYPYHTFKFGALDLEKIMTDELERDDADS